MTGVQTCALPIYFILTADTGECNRVPKPVREREPGGDCGAGDCGYGGEYDCGSFILQNDGWEAESVALSVFVIRMSCYV